jgi:uncharacterized protein (DUF3820 family)
LIHAPRLATEKQVAFTHLPGVVSLSGVSVKETIMSDEKKTAVIPFGKYKGTPLEVVQSTDPKYLDWLSQQDWFREKYANFYQVVINQGNEPSETPEHNALQLKLLDLDFKRAAWMHVVETDQVPERITPEFEWHGIDCLLSADGCHAIIELKPILGDDYPSVVRQIRSYKEVVKRQTRDAYPSLGIIVGTFQSQVATLEQLRKLFGDIQFATVQDIEALKADVPSGIQRRIVHECFFRKERLRSLSKVVESNPSWCRLSHVDPYLDLDDEDRDAITDAFSSHPPRPAWNQPPELRREWEVEGRQKLEEIIAEQIFLADGSLAKEQAKLKEIERQ